MKTYHSHVVEVMENGDAIIDLPKDLLEELGWKEGDTVDVSEQDGKIFIKKIDNAN